MTRTEIALGYFNNQFNCAQSVLVSFASEMELTNDQCLKVACAFGGGMGRQQHTCGAVTGALMVLGMKYGKATYDNEEKKTDTYFKTREFIRAFEAENGTINCKELLQGLNMNNEDDLEEIKRQRLFEISCEKYVADAVKIVEKLIENDPI
jgi:C_GCAxxG_C_C family probable redox protein